MSSDLLARLQPRATFHGGFFAIRQARALLEQGIVTGGPASVGIFQRAAARIREASDGAHESP